MPKMLNLPSCRSGMARSASLALAGAAAGKQDHEEQQQEGEPLAVGD